MSRFETIISNFVQWGNSTDKIYAALVIGSQARTDHPADDNSDLDIIMVADEPSCFLKSNQWLEQIGNVNISFVENTIGGGKERRILFDNALDVDFVILSPTNFMDAMGSSEVSILKRGYRILIDKIGLASILPPAACEGTLKPLYIPPAEPEFVNMVNDFWYHTVWTAKKLNRGEVWTAKFCVDNYMKRMLFDFIECHAHTLHGMDYDTWHDGRFMEEWAEEWIIRKLAKCYAHYEEKDIENALLSTMELFRLISLEIAHKLDYKYPVKADTYASDWVIRALEGTASSQL